jgi:hypothetical protein
MKAARAGVSVAMNAPSFGLNYMKNLMGKNEKLPWYQLQDTQESLRVLSDFVIGGPSFAGRSYETIKPVFDSSVKALTEGAIDSDDLVRTIEGVIGQEFVNSARNGSANGRKKVLETLQGKAEGSNKSVLDTLVED